MRGGPARESKQGQRTHLRRARADARLRLAEPILDAEPELLTQPVGRLVREARRLLGDDVPDRHHVPVVAMEERRVGRESGLAWSWAGLQRAQKAKTACVEPSSQQQQQQLLRWRWRWCAAHRSSVWTVAVLKAEKSAWSFTAFGSCSGTASACAAIGILMRNPRPLLQIGARPIRLLQSATGQTGLV